MAKHLLRIAMAHVNRKQNRSKDFVNAYRRKSFLAADYPRTLEDARREREPPETFIEHTEESSL